MFLSRVRNTYYLFFTDETGTRRKVSTRCSRKADAVTFLREFKQGEYEQRTKLRRISLSAFKEEYIQFASSTFTRKTASCAGTAFREFLRIVGDVPLRSIGIREIEQFLSIKKVEASEWTARKYYIALASAFEKALQWAYLMGNPFRKVSKPKVPEILPAYFTECDFRVFLSVVEDQDFRELCITGLLTGVRLGELLALRWTDVDFTGKVIFVHNSDAFITKTRKNRVVPMNEELCRLLRDRKDSLRVESDFLFHTRQGGPLKAGTVSGRFKKYVRAACLNDKLHFHSLRHSFASALVLSGVSLYAVQKLLGHTTSRTTEIYSHLLPQQLHNEVNRLAEIVFSTNSECAQNRAKNGASTNEIS